MMWRRLVGDGEPVVECGHVGADDEPGDVEGALDGVVGPDDVEDGRAVGDAQPGGLRADRHPGCYLLLDLRNGRHRVDAGDVAARSSAGDEVGVAVAGGDGEIAVG